jgi:hypothetical protein
MKKIFVFVVLTIFISKFVSAREKNDSLQIIDCVKDYLEGWYNGNVERMDKALHPDLTKHKLNDFKPTGGHIMQTLSKLMMLEYTKSGFDKQTPRDKVKIDIEVMDIYGKIAMVKSTTLDFIDYIHLVKYNYEWKIINVLWESVPKN